MSFNHGLEIGQVIQNEDIHRIFKVDKQQGIRTSTKYNYIIIISKNINNQYHDKWINDYLIMYTGVGQKGDQKMSGRNKTLANVIDNNKELFFFEMEKKKEYIFRGKCYLDGKPSESFQKDTDGKMRKVIQFPLRLEHKRRDFVADKKTIEIYSHDEIEYKMSFNNLNSNDVRYNSEFEYKMRPAKKRSPILKDGIKVYERNKTKSKNALKKAKYRCEYNISHESFVRKKIELKYTEPHHLVPMEFSGLFDYSLDVEENIVSLCSECHNLIHYGRDRFVLLEKLYNERKELLKLVGININFEELKQMYK